jgi:hypothetical protein
MSQEQPPIRSRRELRKARDANQASVSTGADQLSPAPKLPPANRPAPDAASPGAEQTHTQRSSQIRARDRAALRTIKELEEKEGQLAGGGAPTRRQLRLQQLKEQTLTAANPIVAPAGPPAPAVLGSAPVVPGGNRPGPAAGQENRAGQQDPTLGNSRAAPARSSAVPDGMTVEQALAARALIAEQAKNQIAKMQHIASLDPEAVDPEILAEQIALAERAAVMNRRAMAKQKLAEQAGAPAAKEPAPQPPVPQGLAAKERPAAGKPPAEEQGRKAPSAGSAPRPAPSAASNLAMVTPLEFVQVPGVDRPVMKPPATSHVPVTTRPGTKVPPSGTKKRRPGGGRPAASDAGTGRSQVIARAEAAAKAAARPKPAVLPAAVVADSHSEDAFADVARVPARSAHGLDPLDAATAGLARATRNRVLQICVLAFGILALIAGVILIISGMSR